jgi:predicted signal transduction protein with EAL and GGDEF domain
MDHPVSIGTSIGIAVSSGEAMDSDLLIHQADVALYRAKFECGASYQIFDAGKDAVGAPARRAS